MGVKILSFWRVCVYKNLCENNYKIKNDYNKLVITH